MNEKIRKVMIFNFTNKYQFTTKLKMKRDYLEVEKQAKLLGELLLMTFNGTKTLNTW